MSDKKPASLSTVQNFLDPEQLKRDVSFSDHAITDAYMEQASLYVEYAQIAQKAELQSENFKHRLEIIEAQVDQEIRDDFAENCKKVTEAQVSKALTLDRRVIGIRKRYNEARSIAGLSKSALEAIKHKKDMLIQCGADLREEQKGQLRMRDTGDRGEVAKQKISKAMGT